ncbi:MAG: hypothetical protein Q9169_006331 [Polycauliona sp. 2 TL-2023]
MGELASMAPHNWRAMPLGRYAISPFLSQDRQLPDGLARNLRLMSKEQVSTHDVFTVFENGGGWLTTTVSVYVGLLGSVFATYGT